MSASENPLRAKFEMGSYLLKEKLRKGYRSQLRRKLKNHNFSIISNNCVAGIIYYNLGERFLSPTINLAVNPDEYLTFLENFDEALSADVEPFFETAVSYPVGIIRLNSGKSVRLYFKHYKTFEEAVEKWYERRERVNRDNMFVLMEMKKHKRGSAETVFLR